MYGYQEAAHTGSLAAMKGVCYVIRNRVRAGWYDADWLKVMEHADESAGNEPEPHTPIDVNNRNFQALLRDVDDLYYATAEDDTARVIGNSLYYQHSDKSPRQWFVDNVARNAESHRRVTHIGSIAFFE